MEHEAGAKEQATAEVAAPAPPEAVAAPVPVASMPIALPGLVVGSASDGAEADADRRADVALGRLAGAGEQHQHGPGCAHVRRSVAPAAGGAAVGLAGGALDEGASSAVEALRGRGRPLEGPTLRRMESAFGTGLSSVRVHDDERASGLAAMMSAKAFTTGRDIFFGRGEFAPDTAAGERTLAHEVAHTLQPEQREQAPGALRRLVTDGSEGPDAPVQGPAPKVEVIAGDADMEQYEGGEAMPARPRDQQQVAITSMDDLLGTDTLHARALANNSNVGGPLQDILVNAFEANWFKAKECLVFGKWPGKRPAFSTQAGLRLMTGLTVLRGAIHEKVIPLARAQVKVEMETRAKTLSGNAGLRDTLTSEAGLDGGQQIDYKGSVGADTVTSDVDVSTGGMNTELGVKAYNTAFRSLMQVEFDPGTVLDLNVYAMDFVFGAKTDDKKDKETKKDAVAADGTKEKGTIEVLKEHSDTPEAADKSAADREQEIWSLVHVARYLPDDADWAAYVEKAMVSIGNQGERARQRELYVQARSRAKGFEMMLRSQMDDLAEDVQKTIDKLGASAWGGEEAEHFDEGALRMRAANAMYEKKLLQVKDLRAQINELKQDKAADPAKIKKLVARVAGEVSMAQLYANEVYGSGGATVHAVFGMQTKKKKQKEWGKAVVVKMPPEQWFEAFNDNLGDVLKDYEHYGTAHGHDQPDYWYAAFKMGKYADRMVDAIPQLAEGGLLGAEDLATLQRSEDFVALTELARHHVTEKDGPSKNDPKKLKKHPYFGELGKKDVDRIKWQALDLGAMVRGMVAVKKASPPVAPEAAAGPAQAPPPPSGDGPAAELAETRQRADAVVARVEAQDAEIAAKK